MELLPNEILNKLPQLVATSEMNANEVKVQVKLFTPDAQCTWYITEYDGKDLFFGFGSYEDDRFAELGYMSKSELESIRGGLGLPVERESFWDENTSLEQVMNFSVR